MATKSNFTSEEWGQLSGARHLWRHLLRGDRVPLIRVLRADEAGTLR